MFVEKAENFQSLRAPWGTRVEIAEAATAESRKTDLMLFLKNLFGGAQVT